MTRMTFQTTSHEPPSLSDTFTIHTSNLFSSRTKTFLQDTSISICRSTGLIVQTYTRKNHLTDYYREGDLDLTAYTVLPGLVDAHTHIFLHPYSEASSINQERDESLPERILRASNHCRAALKAGYTTYRDLGTEGLAGADTGVRDAINRRIIPGPRLFVATEPLASSASYAIRYESRMNGTSVPPLAEYCDGVDGVTAAVRKRIGAGADFIKVYADYRRRTLRWPGPAYPGGPHVLHPPKERGPLSDKGRNPNSCMWRQEELDAIVVEANRAGAPVAAHAGTKEAVVMAARAGVTSIEHGFACGDAGLQAMKDNGTIFVPTLAVVELYKAEIAKKEWEDVLGQVSKAHDMGIKLAAGGDTGAFAHGDNAREIELLVEAGVPVVDALRAATLGGFEAVGGHEVENHDWEEGNAGRKFGALEEGWSADLIALDGDPMESIKALRRVKLVVKDGRVVVSDGRLIEYA